MNEQQYLEKLSGANITPLDNAEFAQRLGGGVQSAYLLGDMNAEPAAIQALRSALPELSPAQDTPQINITPQSIFNPLVPK